MTWETWTNGINQSEIACKMPQCNPEKGWSIWQYFGDNGVAIYQGWFFVIFVTIGFLLIGIAVYLIATGYFEPETKTVEKKEPEKISKGKRK